MIEGIKNEKSLPVNPSQVCTQWPEEPTGDYTQRDVADYIIDGRGAYNDCAEKLKECLKRN
jgi:hypothetical protein